MKNALEAIPNDEDLELVYSWQRKQFQNKQAEKEKQLMKKVWLIICKQKFLDELLFPQIY